MGLYSVDLPGPMQILADPLLGQALCEPHEPGAIPAIPAPGCVGIEKVVLELHTKMGHQHWGTQGAYMGLWDVA